MTPRRLTIRELAAYGLLGLPLAMAALPLYVHLPKFYGDDLGMSLGLVGAILLATRLTDALSDPLLGYLSDRMRSRRLLVALSLPLLGVGMAGLFHPPAAATLHPVWLAGLLVLVYLGFSAATIGYSAWGAQLSRDVHERTRITAAREIFTLVGVVIAAALPSVLGGENATGFGRFSFVFAALLFAGGAVTLAFAPLPLARPRPPDGLFAATMRPLANRGFRRLLVVFMLSGIAAAIPSTLVLFFIEDVLDAQAATPVFLVIYFLSGALGIPFWVWLSRRIGKKGAWLAGMLLAVVAFVWAFRLGEGDVVAYAVICFLSGLALGADLALPPSLLADVIDEDQEAALARSEGAYFGLWALVTKANLAIAAGIALPLVAWLGYQPGEADSATRSLAFVYCLVPCVLKLASAAVLWLGPRSAHPARLGLQGE